MRTKGFEFGPEQKKIAEFRPIQRLDAEPVAHKRQRALAPIPKANGKHADETFRRCFNTVSRKSLQHHFGVRVTAKLDAARFEFGTHLLEIVDFAIVRNDEAAVGGDHWLVAGGREIDNGQAPVRQHDSGLGIAPEPMIVGAAVCDAVGHRDRIVLEPIACARRVEYTSDAAHWYYPEARLIAHCRLLINVCEQIQQPQLR